MSTRAVQCVLENIEAVSLADLKKAVHELKPTTCTRDAVPAKILKEAIDIIGEKKVVRYKDRHKEARLGTEEEPESDWGRPTGSKPPADTDGGAGGSPHRNGVFRRYHRWGRYRQHSWPQRPGGISPSALSRCKWGKPRPVHQSPVRHGQGS
ncbi:hypothetical protein DPEC_G00017600 [Dallia pectoralis]|uniref:Uncharacterized protein n=1 Tax=Dallia pectoralis TaxID=75939 RepID=A0ACC2HF89_DALPE|nr:hypothetical protein DPEC_G00017600 [Dallia pectoralis]